jgi:hypothetical protein
MCLKKSQTSDHVGAKILYPALQDGATATLVAYKGYDIDDYRAALRAKGIHPGIPPRKGHIAPPVYCKSHISRDIRSKMCSQGSKTGARSPLAKTDAPTSLWPQSLSSPSSSGGSNDSCA